MEIIKDLPPNFDDIARVFPAARGPGVIFSFGPKLYVPSGKELSEMLMAHETVHSMRQGEQEETILAWWDQYLKDPQFRFVEELLAHKVEYQTYVQMKFPRNERRRAQKMIAKRLSSNLYGGIVSYKKALELIKHTEKPNEQ